MKRNHKPVFFRGKYWPVWFLALMAALALSGEAQGETGGSKNQLQARIVQKSATCDGGKAAICDPQKAATYTRGGIVRVRVRMGCEELEKKLSDWPEWKTPTRIASLLLILAEAETRLKKGGFDFSQARQRALCSPLRASKSGAPLEGLAVLVEAGVLILLHKGQHLPVAKAAEYGFAPAYQRRAAREVELSLNAKLYEKWENLPARVEKAFRSKHPILGVVEEAARKLSFSEAGKDKILSLEGEEKDRLLPSAMACLDAITKGPFIAGLDDYGTINSPIGHCPRVMRPFLLLDGMPVCEVDISGAHPLTLVHLYDPKQFGDFHVGYSPLEVKKEHAEFVRLMEGTDDVYGGGLERKKKKTDMLISLNIEEKIAAAMEVTKELRKRFLILSSTMMQIKKTDHRNLSHRLQRWVSEITNPTIIALSKRGMPGIPIVDSILCGKVDESAVREELSRRLYIATGIRGMVGGVRYSGEG